MSLMNLKQEIIRSAKAAKRAAENLSSLTSREKNNALNRMAEALLKKADYLIKENEKDLEFSTHQGYSQALLDRLRLDQKHIQEMANCLKETTQLKDPVGEIIATFHRPNGLTIHKVRTPIGVIGIIYESRPNVTSDCIGLCLKSGNAVILKGGKEAFYSNEAIFKILRESLNGTAIPPDAIHLISPKDRKAVGVLLELSEYIDLIVPRGGEELIRYVCEHSRIPVVKHDKGICHVYVSDHADFKKAQRICMNAKVQKPAVCNAMETLLVHEKVAKKFLPSMIAQLQDSGVEIRGCPLTRRIVNDDLKKATESDWATEYLDLILSVKVVDSLQGAIEHINKYGSKHSDAIITEDKMEAEKFFKAVDSACLYVNASTRFTDGYQFGFGAEIGISTNKIHARGPMALEELTTYKYLVYGNGQIRT